MEKESRSPIENKDAFHKISNKMKARELIFEKTRAVCKSCLSIWKKAQYI